MVFRAKGAKTFKLKVRVPMRNDGEPRTFSTGMTSKAGAEEVERMVERFKSRRQWAPLCLVFDGHATLGEVYDADIAGTLDELIARANDVNLDPLVSEWAKQANAKYVRQVRTLIAAGERFPASAFRRKRISEFLAGLTCADPTKNRYRAALSVFAKWLVEREVLETNPVRDVAMYGENDPRMVWMTWEDARRVVGAMNTPWAELIAIMAASGMELGAALTLKRTDVDLDARTIHARGSKTPWRNRVVRYEEWAHEEIFYLCATTIGSGELFPPVRHRALLKHFRDSAKAVGLTGHRLHDLRHTYAVNALRKGYKPAVIAHQLGHRDANMVTKVYGRFIPDASDYEVATSATNSATAAKKQREVKRAK